MSEAEPHTGTAVAGGLISILIGVLGMIFMVGVVLALL